MHAEPEERAIIVNGEDETESPLVRRVYERRWLASLHVAGISMFISLPSMHVLGLTPTSVLAGLFLFM